MKSVYVIGPTFGLEWPEHFPAYGYKVYTDRTIDTVKDEDIDFVCWTGGSDISPSLYGQKQNQGTYCVPKRDEKEVALWHKYRDKPKLGICRGAQLLNVLNGGSMYQHVNNHSGPHIVKTDEGKEILLCSVHHQLMIPHPSFQLVAWNTESTYRENDNGHFLRLEDEVDPEVIYIPQDKALCFQAHPEFGPKSCTDYFFQLAERFFG